MVQVDYIIVGGGFAALFFAHQLLKNNKTFVLYSNNRTSASHISAGVCNPVILKRFSTFWKSEEQMQFLESFFAEVKTYTSKNYLINEPVARIFHNESEKTQWIRNSNKETLKPYLNNTFTKLQSVENDFETGIVDKSCRLDVENFFNDFFNYLDKNENLISENFNYKSLDTTNSQYKNYQFKNIVFCEGVNIKNNPYFENIPVLPNKGHCLEVKIDEPIDPYIIKKKHFLFSLSDNRFYYGGTYDRLDETSDINQEFVDELKNGLKEFYKKDFAVTKIKTAFRATVDDRKPILGTHPDFKNLHIFNGLGARGVLNGTYFSKIMFDYLENELEIDSDIDVRRFY